MSAASHGVKSATQRTSSTKRVQPVGISGTIHTQTVRKPERSFVESVPVDLLYSVIPATIFCFVLLRILFSSLSPRSPERKIYFDRNNYRSVLPGLPGSKRTSGVRSHSRTSTGHPSGWHTIHFTFRRDAVRSLALMRKPSGVRRVVRLGGLQSLLGPVTPDIGEQGTPQLRSGSRVSRARARPNRFLLVRG